ncbi:MAG TPA: DUF397 domain-containing protein [Pseudonocardiaceae bacterium]|jgi:hypothetical protein|nr:DUF397 domain-containing protein [Pseudonocardiaceae bacterium]
MITHRAAGSELARVRWIKSSYSGTGGGNCVEVASMPGGHRAVRDSKNPAAAALIFTAGVWTAFAAAVRDGEFD